MIKSGIKKMGLFIAFGAILGGVSAQNSTGDTKEVQSEYAGFKTFRFGGYGEILANFMDYGVNRFSGISYGSVRENRNSISIPRFVLVLTISSIRNGYSVLRSNLKPVVQVWR